MNETVAELAHLPALCFQIVLPAALQTLREMCKLRALMAQPFAGMHQAFLQMI